MCFPPFCEPARRFLGCLSLRSGAIVALLIDAAYGLALVVVHALLLGEDDPETDAKRVGSRGLHGNDWFLQLLDLDVSFGHRLLGNNDLTCLLFGLVYGIVIVVICGYMFQQVQHGGPHVAISSRWFVAFMNLELVIYIGLILCKYPELCNIQDNFLQRLEMDCDLLRFLYLERCVIFLIIGGVCCWIFSSLAYFLAFGVDAINRPDFADALDLHDAHNNIATSQEQQRGLFPNLNFFHNAPSGQPGYTQRVATRPAAQSFRRPVGEPVSVAPYSMTQLPTTSRTSIQPGTATRMSMPPQRTSYHIPRASSSMATTMTSQSQAETRALIKPPVAVF